MGTLAIVWSSNASQHYRAADEGWGGLNRSRNGLSYGGSSKRLVPPARRWSTLMVLVPVVLSCPSCPELWSLSFLKTVVSLWHPCVLSPCSLRSLPAGFGDGRGKRPAAAGEELTGAPSPRAVQHPERPTPAVSPVPGMGLPGGTVVLLGSLTPPTASSQVVALPRDGCLPFPSAS